MWVSGLWKIDASLLDLESVFGMDSFSDKIHRDKTPTIHKIWAGTAYLFPPSVRRDVFEPTFNEMLGEHLRARKFLGNSGRRWLVFAFTFWTMFIVVDCFRVMLQSGAVKILRGLLPEPFRNWWGRR